MELTAANVETVAQHCLFTQEEMPEGAGLPEDAVKVEGIICNYGFNAARLAEKRSDIASMLDCLSDDFKATGGGGMSFLNACMTKSGEHWGEHPTMGLLFALGIGAGLARYTMPREMWPILPGGVPYLTVLDSAAV